jgi:ABC-type cobalamin/Fe3+-siderophores transport system ATPase subunit
MDEVEKLADNLIVKLQQNIEFISAIDKNDNINEKINALIIFVQELKEGIQSKVIPSRYYSQITNDLNFIFFHILETSSLLGLTQMPDGRMTQYLKDVKERIDTPQFDNLRFKYSFYQKLCYFETNIVAIGANGSGKTTLIDKLRDSIGRSGIVICAQKLLMIPTFSSISNINQTKNELASCLQQFKNSKFTTHSKGDYSAIQNVENDFWVLLDYLLSERNAVRSEAWNDAKGGRLDTGSVKTNLDKVIEVWNSLIEHRTLSCDDGINFILKGDAINDYPAFQMSDGEKVMLYHITKVLLAPKDGFIIIDEPEIYLHKTILSKLWDKLEQERNDCLFMYLTHDLEFATNRYSSRKIWIKSFEFPDKWEMEELPENEIPEELLMRLLGSRKVILFCEGDKVSSYDQQIYEILFPNFTITPLKTCKDVINYTKAFNKLSNTNCKAIGIIDSDFRTIEELASLKKFNIYSYSVAEVENLFLNEDFLKSFADWTHESPDCINDLKENILNKFENDKELQISNYLSARINYQFSSTHVSKGNTKECVAQNYTSFTNEIKIDDWYSEREILIDKVVNEKDYSKAILLYNNKGLSALANSAFKMKNNFHEKAIRFLKEETEPQNILRSCFPDEIVHWG